MLLTYLLRQEWLEPEQLPRAIDALREAATDPAQHELLVRSWVHLAPTLRVQPRLFEALVAMPCSVQHDVAARIANGAHDAVLHCYAAAIELGGSEALVHVRNALDRLQWVTFSTFAKLGEKLRGLAGDDLLIDCATRALRRLRSFPTPFTLSTETGFAFQLFTLVVLAGGEDAAKALGHLLRSVDAETAEQHLYPRLALAGDRPHVAEAMQWKEREQLPPPFSVQAPRAAQPPRPITHERLDDNLRLALLQAALDAGRIELPTLEAIDPYGDDFEAESAGMRAALLQVELPADFVAQLRELRWDGTGEVAERIVPEWGGESDVFDVSHLAHVSMLPALESLHLELASEEPAADLGPLRALPNLTHFTWWARVPSLAPLLDLPRLVEVVLRYDPTAENAAVCAQLAARGVTLRSR